MGDQTIIKNKAAFESTATTFLDKMFKPVLENNLGDIEVRIFASGYWPRQYFCQTTKEAAEIAYDLCNSGIDVYFGVNLRTGRAGKKEECSLCANADAGTHCSPACAYFSAIRNLHRQLKGIGKYLSPHSGSITDKRVD